MKRLSPTNCIPKTNPPSWLPQYLLSLFFGFEFAKLQCYWTLLCVFAYKILVGGGESGGIDSFRLVMMFVNCTCYAKGTITAQE